MIYTMGVSWIVLAILSAVFAALVAIFGKVGLEKLDSTTATAVRAVVMAIFLIGVVAIQGKFGKVHEIIANHKALYYIILSGVAGALSWIFYFLALKIGPVSGVVSIDKLAIVFAVLLAALFLAEKVTFVTWIGVALMAIGAILISLK